MVRVTTAKLHNRFSRSAPARPGLIDFRASCVPDAHRRRSFAAIGEYAHDTGRTILDRLGVAAVVPHGSTIRRVLRDLDPVEVEAAMPSWVLAQLADQPRPNGVPVREQRRVLALVGKTVCLRHEVARDE